MKGWWCGSVGNALAVQPGDLSSIPRIHTVEERTHSLPQVVSLNYCVCEQYLYISTYVKVRGQLVGSPFSNRGIELRLRDKHFFFFTC